jgi:hypothetical protein
MNNLICKIKNRSMLSFLSSVLVLLFSATFVHAQYEECILAPSFTVMKTPKNIFKWLPGEGFRGKCDSIPAYGWKKLPCGNFDLMVHTDGPGGSMREWEIFVGIGPKGGNNPTRGFCLSTFTVGWRTLQKFHTLPLPWIQDRNNDGKAELIIWSSFPLHDEASLAEYGLVAWVYKVDKDGTFTIDLDSSRILAGEIASAYREPLDRPDSGYPNDERMKAADALERFASAKCKLEIEVNPRK